VRVNPFSDLTHTRFVYLYPYPTHAENFYLTCVHTHTCSLLIRLPLLGIIERNARFSMWYGVCVHVACMSYLLIANVTVKLFV